jgi:hypothetical protein
MACQPNLQTTVDEVLAQVEAGAIATVMSKVDPAYVDALGDRRVLEDDLKDITRRFPRVVIEHGPARIQASLSEAAPILEMPLTIELIGDRVWHIRDKERWTLIRTVSGYVVRSGLMTHTREILSILEAQRAQLKIHDLDGLAALRHPSLSSWSSETRQRWEAELQNRNRSLDCVTHYRAEVRPDLVHVDAHLRAMVDGGVSTSTVHRMTLKRSGGRLLFVAGLVPVSWCTISSPPSRDAIQSKAKHSLEPAVPSE